MALRHQSYFPLNWPQSKWLYCLSARGGPEQHSLLHPFRWHLLTPQELADSIHISSNMLQPRNIVQSKINIGCMLQRWPTLVTTEFCVRTLTRPVEQREESL